MAYTEKSRKDLKKMIQKILLTVISFLGLISFPAWGQQISNHLDLVDTSNGKGKFTFVHGGG